jgi:hypothetical protein
VKWADLGLTKHGKVRDLWAHQDVKTGKKRVFVAARGSGKAEAWAGPEFAVTVPSHGVAMFRVEK